MPRLLTEKQAADELGIELSIFRHLVEAGRLPPPLPEFDRFDVKALHRAVDRMSGLEPAAGGRVSILDDWLANEGAQHADQDSSERRYHGDGPARRRK